MEDNNPAEEQSPGSVLFVDDEKNILNALRRLTVEEGFRVLTAASGAEGLEILRREKDVGLIISDQRMPTMTGSQFLAEARALAPEALRIILTGYADINATIDAINKGGAYRYISKPWDDEELLKTIRESLHYYNLSRENKRLNSLVSEKNEELKGWNTKLRTKVLQQTTSIREKNELLSNQNASLKSNFHSTIKAFSGLIELRAEEVRNHSRNVADASVAMAKTMGLPPKELETIFVAATLHDIGKIGIPDETLGKSLKQMTETESLEYLRHPVRGQVAIDAIVDLRPAGILIRHHHEHFDGSGFPDGLHGEEIPLGARILAITDYVDVHIREGQENPFKTILERTSKHLVSRFDPALFPFVEKAIRATYAKLFEKSALKEKMISPAFLRDGMVLAEDLYSATGLLLLNKGTDLDRARIESILRFHSIDPFEGGIHVLLQ